MALNKIGTGEWINKGLHIMTWSGITTTGPASALDASHLPDKTVVLSGTIGSGTTVVIEGSNTASGPLATGASRYYTLNDPQGNALSLSTGKVEAILENPKFIRPKTTAKNANTNVTVTIISQSHQR
jgi:hypothetical protein